MTHKILIVEDNAILALDIQRVLKNLGYEECYIATNFDEGLEGFEKHNLTLMLVDINLEHSRSGIELVEATRAKSQIPVIYLTAFSDDALIQKAAMTNPSSYIVKPFKKEDLKTAIGLALFKSAQTYSFSSNCFRLDDEFCFDLSQNTLYLKDKLIALGSKEQQLLHILIKANGQIVSYDVLESQIWINIAPSESSLRTLIYRLKLKLHGKFIETISLVGARLFTH